MKLDFIFQNEHFVAIDKAPNCLTTPSRMGATETRPILGRIVEKELKKQIFPVHRLDYEVSGLVLFAMNREAHKAANLWFEEHQVTKIYETLTSGLHPHIQEGQVFHWKSKILRGKKRAYEHKLGKEAITQATVLKIETYIHWKLNPKTGRPHQLRFELSKQGFPIIGDHLYGSTESYEGIALRAVSLEFPVEAEKLGLPQKLSTAGF